MISFRPDREFCDLIMPYIEKIGVLWVAELATIEDLTQVRPNFPLSTPNLRQLELVWDDHSRAILDPSMDPFESLPNTLRSLLLDDIPLYPSFLKLGNLTELTLIYSVIHTPSDTILDILEENPSLESAFLVSTSKNPLLGFTDIELWS